MKFAKVPKPLKEAIFKRIRNKQPYKLALLKEAILLKNSIDDNKVKYWNDNVPAEFLDDDLENFFFFVSENIYGVGGWFRLMRYLYA